MGQSAWPGNLICPSVLQDGMGDTDRTTAKIEKLVQMAAKLGWDDGHA